MDFWHGCNSVSELHVLIDFSTQNLNVNNDGIKERPTGTDFTTLNVLIQVLICHCHLSL